LILIDSLPYEIEIGKAKNLLHKDKENSLPENIVNIIQFCVEKKIGFVLSRNAKVFSCKDARSNRARLGLIGIPLFDELKSIVFKGNGIDGRELIIAAHCRGHMNVDVQKISQIFSCSGTPHKMDDSEMIERFNMDFGTVNPMLIEMHSNNIILNVFDTHLTKPMLLYPGTMLTNAGEHTWGIEFDPSLLISAIDNRIIESIAVPNENIDIFDSQAINPKSIGIITGSTPIFGVVLWEAIINNFKNILGKRFAGDISLPKINIVSLPSMGLSMEPDKHNTATLNTILEAVDTLRDMDILMLACHTTHCFTGNIRNSFEQNGGKFISMSESVIEYIIKSQIQDVAILGINYVAELNDYNTCTDLKKLQVESISPEITESFHKLAYSVKKMENLYGDFQKFTRLVNKHIKSNNIVIALPEFSVLYHRFTKRKFENRNIIDPLEIYAKKISSCSLGIISS